MPCAERSWEPILFSPVLLIHAEYRPAPGGSHEDWELWLRNAARAVRDQWTIAETALKPNRLALWIVLKIHAPAGSRAKHDRAPGTAPTLTTIARTSKATGLVPHTVTKVFAALSEAGIVHEITGKQRNRLFAYGELIDTMDEGTKPL
jgi:hypothetical protein